MQYWKYPLLVTWLLGWFPVALLATQPPITGMVFSSDGNQVVAVGQAGIQIFDWPQLKLQRVIPSAAANLHDAAFSPDGSLLAVGGGRPSEEGILEVFAWPEGKRVTLVREHDDSVSSLAWQDNSHVLTASYDREIHRVNIPSGAVETVYQGHSRALTGICLLPKGTQFVSVGHDQSVRVWDLAAGNLVRSLRQHTQSILGVSLRPTDTGLPMVASAAKDRTIRFWQPTIGRMVRYIRLDAVPLAIAWSRDGSQLVAGLDNGRVAAIDPNTVKLLSTTAAIDGWAYAVAVHPSDDALVVGGTNGSIRRVPLRRPSP